MANERVEPPMQGFGRDVGSGARVYYGRARRSVSRLGAEGQDSKEAAVQSAADSGVVNHT